MDTLNDKAESRVIEKEMHKKLTSRDKYLQEIPMTGECKKNSLSEGTISYQNQEDSRKALLLVEVQEIRNRRDASYI